VGVDDVLPLRAQEGFVEPVVGAPLQCDFDALRQVLARRGRERPAAVRQEPGRDRVQVLHVDALARGVVAHEDAQAMVEAHGERFRERGQQHPAARKRARQEGRAVQRDDALAGAGAAGHARGAAVALGERR
jgi:hypothetical protein